MSFQTIVVYIGTLIIGYKLFDKAEKTSKKIYVIIVASILTFIGGFRGYSVGIDTSNYVTLFEIIRSGNMAEAYGLEESFKVIVFFLLKILNNPSFIFVLLAAITNFLVLFRLWEYREIASAKISFMCYYMVYFFASLNICRQYAAVAIVFWATRFLEKRKYSYYILFVILASLFHRSSIIGLAFFIFEIPFWRTLKFRQKILLLFGVSVVPFLTKYAVVYLAKYDNYFSLSQSDVGIMLPIKLFIFFLTLLVTRHRNSCVLTSSNNKITIWYKSGTITWYYAFGLILTFVGYYYQFMDRISLPFYLFESLYFAKTLKHTTGNNRKIFCLLFLAIVFYYFFTALVNSSQGQMPYVFVWQ